MMFAFLTCIRRPHVTYASNSPVEEESSTVGPQEGVDARVGRCRRKTALYLCTPAEAGEMKQEFTQKVDAGVGNTSRGRNGLAQAWYRCPGCMAAWSSYFVSLPFLLVCASAEDRTHALSHYPGGLADL